MKKYILSLAFLFSVVSTALAVVATPEPVLRVLPDGTVAEVYIRGDEHYHYLSTLYGNRIAGSETGVSSDYLFEQAKAPRAVKLSSFVPSSGTVRIPVVLVNFTDVKFTMPNPVENFSAFFNTTGGTNPYATGSVHNYYLASSDSALNLVFDVYGPYDLSREMAYYGGNTSTSSIKNASALVMEAASLADADGVDFSPYDNDNDGYIDNLSIVVAGYNEAEGGPADAIWPHYSQVFSTRRFSDKGVRGYLMISEYRSSGGSIQAGIGTYCHEFGHALGLPDLYDTQDDYHYTVGSWDVMATGSYNNNGSTPPTYSAFERFMMGWLQPEQLINSNNYILPPIATSNKAYLIADTVHNMEAFSPNPVEYFLLENRQALGWDAVNNALVGTGMMVSHIMYSSFAWNNNTFNNNSILGYGIVSAAIAVSSGSTPADLFPGTMAVTTWIPKLHSGEQLLEQTLNGISQQVDGNIAFHYGMQADKGFFFSPQSLISLTTTYDNGKPIDYEVADLELTIKDIDSDTFSIRTSNNYFSYSLDGGNTWSADRTPQYIKAFKDTTYTMPIQVRYAPVRQSCDSRTAYLIVETPDNAFVNQIQLTGVSPRPTYITTPVVAGAKDVSSSSFTVVWDEQPDAELYYLTLYSVAEGVSSEIQTFDDISSLDALRQQGWDANFFDVTSTIAESGKALYFTQTGNQVETVDYLISPTSIRFWLSNNFVLSHVEAAPAELLLEGLNKENQWKRIDNLRIQQTTRNLTKEYTLDTNEGYTRFRLTYTHNGGTGGVSLDGFTANIDGKISYVCKGTERSLSGLTTQAIFTGLQPSTTYYFSVQAFEYKGCEEHFSALSAPVEITTLSQPDENAYLSIYRTQEGQYVAILPEYADGSSTLYVFDFEGRLINSASIPYGTKDMVVPTEGMVFHNHYLLKVVQQKMKRKTAKGKLFYY